MSEPNVAELKELPSSQHFTIRGHHLPFYVRLFKGDTPSSIASSVTNGLGKYRTDAQQFPEDPHHTWKEHYVNDVLGDPKNAVNHQDSIQQVFEEFMNLPDNAKVDILEQPDNICKRCAIGDHCLVNFQKGYTYPGSTKTALKEDRRLLNKFYRRAQELHLDSAMTISYEQVHFTDDEDHPSGRLTATAGVIKQVLKSISGDPGRWEDSIS